MANGINILREQLVEIKKLLFDSELETVDVGDGLANLYNCSRGFTYALCISQLLYTKYLFHHPASKHLYVPG